MSEMQDLGSELKATGKDLNFGGGYRMVVGGWKEDNIAATQTDTAMELFGEGDSIAAYRCVRAGSITGLSAQLSANATGAGILFEVFKNGSAVNADCALTVAINTDGNQTTFAKDLYTVAAGDELDVRFTTNGSWTGTTVDCAVWIEIEQ